MRRVWLLIALLLGLAPVAPAAAQVEIYVYDVLQPARVEVVVASVSGIAQSQVSGLSARRAVLSSVPIREASTSTTPLKLVVATNNGPPFENRYPQDTPGYTQRIAAEIALARSGTYIYVVQDGILKIGPRSGNHIDLAEGRPVEAAGEFTTKGGKVVRFNNASGHYCPSGPEAEAAARAGFARYNMSITGPYTEVGG